MWTGNNFPLCTTTRGLLAHFRESTILTDGVFNYPHILIVANFFIFDKTIIQLSKAILKNKFDTQMIDENDENTLDPFAPEPDELKEDEEDDADLGDDDLLGDEDEDEVDTDDEDEDDDGVDWETDEE
jgi:hypothetical protein